MKFFFILLSLRTGDAIVDSAASLTRTSAAISPTHKQSRPLKSQHPNIHHHPTIHPHNHQRIFKTNPSNSNSGSIGSIKGDEKSPNDTRMPEFSSNLVSSPESPSSPTLQSTMAPVNILNNSGFIHNQVN
jgi:hypothetical protein